MEQKQTKKWKPGRICESNSQVELQTEKGCKIKQRCLIRPWCLLQTPSHVCWSTALRLIFTMAPYLRPETSLVALVICLRS